MNYTKKWTSIYSADIIPFNSQQGSIFKSRTTIKYFLCATSVGPDVAHKKQYGILNFCELGCWPFKILY